MDPQPEWANEMYESPRNGIPYTDCPPCYTVEDYGAILDSVFEMAEAVMSSNGVSAARALWQVYCVEGVDHPATAQAACG